MIEPFIIAFSLIMLMGGNDQVSTNNSDAPLPPPFVVFFFYNFFFWTKQYLFTCELKLKITQKFKPKAKNSLLDRLEEQMLG